MTLTVIALVLILNFFNVLLKLENQSIDFRFNVRGVRQPQAPVKIIAIDEKSLQEVGQWPWPRAVHAQLVRRLKADGVKCVFYDVFFAEPERTQEKMLGQVESLLSHSMEGSEKAREKILSDLRRFSASQNGDAEFAKAIKETGNVFMLIEPLVKGKGGRTPDPETLNLTDAELFGGFTNVLVSEESLIVSIPEIQKNSKDSGHTRCLTQGDLVIRYYPTVIDYKEKLIPHLSLQVVRHFLGSKEPVKVRLGEHYTEVAGRKIPILSNGMAFINFCGPDTTIPTYSASDILNNRIKPGELKDTIVEIGPTAEGINDIRPTPFSRISPGVVINANIMENVISGNFLTLAPKYLRYLLVIFMSFLMWYLIPRLTPLGGAAAFVSSLILYLIVSCLLFSYAHLVIDVTHPNLALILTFTVLTTYKFRTEVRHGRHLKNMFQSMVTPKVVDAILKSPTGITLGGEEKELTVMFSDIRGFTTYSEKHTPPEVIAVLNEYLTQMTDLVFTTEGTLDKYIGDAIMAFWGAPVFQEDHAYRACSTALGMVEFLHDVLHPKWESEGKEKLQIGLGLNTGGMVVGFVGSQAIKNYTLIGDEVNLCSRLEGTTKEYRVEIIIAESTFEKVKDDMLCRELDLIQVKGKTKPIRIYQLLDRRFKASEKTNNKVEAFHEGLVLYRAQKWDEAAKKFEKCLELDPQDGPGAIFLERCKHLKGHPPAVNWDGVYVMKTK